MGDWIHPKANATRAEASTILRRYGEQLVNAETPSITDQPTDGSYVVGDTAAALTVTAGVTDGGTLSYQRYSNNVNNNTSGSAIGVSSASYTPPTGTAGTTYYYVAVVTNTNTNTGVNGNQTASVTSSVAEVIMNAGLQFQHRKGVI